MQDIVKRPKRNVVIGIWPTERKNLHVRKIIPSETGAKSTGKPVSDIKERRKNVSAKREKQVRQMVLACEKAAAQCSDSLDTIGSMYWRIEKSQADQRRYIDSRLRKAERHQREEMRRVKTMFVTGFVVSCVIAGCALGIATKEPEEPVRASTTPIVVSPVRLTTPKLVSAPESVTVTEHPPEIPLSVEDQEALCDAAEEFGIPFPLALAVVERETQFNNIAGDSGNSIGYMQVNRFYHTGLMEDIGASDLWVPEDNFRTGLAILSREIQENSTLHKALMCYNMGPGGARKCWNRGVYSSEYSRQIVDRAGYWSDVLG